MTTLEYDGANRLWKTTGPGAGTEIRLYWPDGKLKSLQSRQGRITSYGYDNAGELTSVVDPNGNVSGANAADWTGRALRVTLNAADAGEGDREAVVALVVELIDASIDFAEPYVAQLRATLDRLLSAPSSTAYQGINQRADEVVAALAQRETANIYVMRLWAASEPTDWRAWRERLQEHEAPNSSVAAAAREVVSMLFRSFNRLDQTEQEQLTTHIAALRR